MINTLDDMLVEVQKIFGNDAYLDSNLDDEIRVDYNKWFGKYMHVILDAIYIQGNKGWSFASDNPQDILDILRAIHNCGLPEEEKIK